MLDQLVADLLFHVRTTGAESRNTVDRVLCEVIPVEVVSHDHVERGRRRSLFLVSAHVQVAVVAPPIRQAVDQPRIAVEGEHDRLVRRKEEIELIVGEAVRVLALRLQLHQVDDIDDTHLQRGELLP